MPGAHPRNAQQRRSARKAGHQQQGRGQSVTILHQAHPRQGPVPEIESQPDQGALLERPTELRGRKALVAVEVRQLWIMGQQCGLLMEVKDVKLQDAAQECPL